MRMRKIQTETGHIGTKKSEIGKTGIGIGLSSVFHKSGDNITTTALAAGYFGCTTPAPAPLVDNQKRNEILRKAASAFKINFISAPFKDEAA